MGIKTTSASAGLGHFQAIAGVKMLVDTLDSKTTALAECKYDCLLSSVCTSFSYAAQTMHCVKSEMPLSIGSDWDYYERGHGDSRDKTIHTGLHTRELMRKRHMGALD